MMIVIIWKIMILNNLCSKYRKISIFKTAKYRKIRIFKMVKYRKIRIFKIAKYRKICIFRHSQNQEMVPDRIFTR